MKKLLSILLVFVLMSVIAQGQIATSVNPGGSRSLTGSYAEFNPSAGGSHNYTPGTTQDFAFKAYSYSPDWEYVYNLWLQFPAGWIVNNVSIIGAPVCNVGSWGNFGFLLETPSTVNISHSRYMSSGGDFCEANYLVNVTVPPTASGNAFVSWYWDGDSYGGAPHNPCSNDQFTPPSMAGQPCDEYLNPRAIIPMIPDLLLCPNNAVYSQPPVNVANAYISDESTLWGDQRVFENFSGVTSAITSITFWGVLFDGGNCYTGGSDNFVITFYQDNGGTVGAVVQTFSVTIMPSPTGLTIADAILLKYAVYLPSSVNLSNGWVMIYRENPGNSNCAFAWALTDIGDDLVGFNQSGGTIAYLADNMAFCLGSGTEMVPLSNWALFIGIGLILVFAIVRSRRLI